MVLFRQNVLQPRTQALLPTPGAAAKTLAKAGHVTSQILGGELNYTKGGVVEERFVTFAYFGKFIENNIVFILVQKIS